MTNATDDRKQPEEAVKRKPLSWFKTQQRRLWWQLHRRYPGAIASPYGSDRNYYKKRDPEENEQTRLPEGEELRVPIVWAAEVFGPSEIDTLYANLKRLGWDADGRGLHAPGVLKWITEQRMYGTSGIYNLGLVTRRSEARFLIRDYFAPLPDEVDYLIAKVHQLSTSLTCVLIGFVMKDDVSVWYQNELSKDRMTTRRPLSKQRSISIWGVEHLKREGIEKARTRYRSIVKNWFSTEMPGFFSRAEDGNRLPIAELITTRLARCLAESSGEGKRNRYDWRRLLINPRSSDVWTSSSCAGLQLVLDEFDDDARFHIVIALATGALSDDQLKYLGGRTTHSLVAYTDEQVSGILAYYSAVALLREAGRSVKLSREQLKVEKSDSSVRDVLENIRRFFKVSMGLPAVANDLLKSSANVSWYRYYCEQFTSKGWPSEGGKIYNLPEVLCERTNYLADRFINEEVASREQFEQLASILSIRESVKTQRRMEHLTIIALVVAFASLIAALPPEKDWPKAMQELWQTYWHFQDRGRQLLPKESQQ